MSPHHHQRKSAKKSARLERAGQPTRSVPVLALVALLPLVAILIWAVWTQVSGSPQPKETASQPEPSVESSIADTNQAELPAATPETFDPLLSSGLPPLGLSLSTVPPHPEEDPPGNLSDPEIAVALMERANELLRQDKLEEAIADFRHSLKHDPGSEDIHYNLGIALGRAGHDEEAMAHYQEAIRILPDYAEAHNNLGNLFVRQGKYDEAISHFEKALEVNPDSSSTLNNLGTALAKKGRVAEATVHFAKASSMDPNYLEAQFNLATAYLSLGRVDESINELIKVLNKQPDFAPAQQALMKARHRKSLRSP